MKFKKLSYLLLTLALMGCEQNEQNKAKVKGGGKTPVVENKPATTDASSDLERMKEKYSDAKIICDLWFEEGGQITSKDQRSDHEQAVFDLLSDKTPSSRTLEVSESNLYYYKVDIDISSHEILKSYVARGNDKKFRSMKNSPTYNLNINRTLSLRRNAEKDASVSQYTSRKLYEQIKESAYRETIRIPQTSKPRTAELECEITTTAREGFQGEYQIENPTPNKPPVQPEPQPSQPTSEGDEDSN